MNFCQTPQRMRPLLRALLIAVALIGCLTHCKSDKKTPAPQSNAAKNIMIKGGWEWVKLLVSPPTDDGVSDILELFKTIYLKTNGCRPNFYFTFKSDGTVVSTTNDLCPGGFTPPEAGLQDGDRWSINDNIITLKHADGSQTQAEVSFQDPYKSVPEYGQMTWVHQEGDRTYTHIFWDR